jgi:hypothetical protein
MGKFKDQGNPALALAEECSEVIKVITKLQRFQGQWHETPDGDTETRWKQLCSEMEDVMYQWKRLKEEVGFNDMLELSDWECTEGTLHGANEECDCQNWSSLTEADFWDGDNSPSE